jgi:DtxR family Mn-dependent transcriptional regulator
MQEYLEAILRLELKYGVARTSDLARELNVTPGTVTSAVEQLKKFGFVVHEPYKGVRLTEAGRRQGVTMLRRHRLAERLLTDLLHVNWSKSHRIACEFEHVIDEDVARAIEKQLKGPATCPHGNPIPDADGNINEDKSMPLVSLGTKTNAVVVKIVEEKEPLLKYLSSLGLMPGVELRVEQKAPLHGPLMVNVHGSSYALGRDVASLIFVKKV